MSSTRNTTLDGLLSGDGNSRIRRVRIGGLTGFVIGGGSGDNVAGEWLDELLSASPDRLKEMIAEEGEDAPCPRCNQRHYGSGFMARLNSALGDQKDETPKFAAEGRTWEEDLADALDGKLTYAAPAKPDAEAEMVGQLLADSLNNDRPAIIRMLGRLKLDLTVSDELLIAQTRTSKRLSQNLLEVKRHYKAKLKGIKRRIQNAIESVWRSPRAWFDTYEIQNAFDEVLEMKGDGDEHKFFPEEEESDVEEQMSRFKKALETLKQEVGEQPLSAVQIRQAVDNILNDDTAECGHLFTASEQPQSLISEQDRATLVSQSAERASADQKFRARFRGLRESLEARSVTALPIELLVETYHGDGDIDALVENYFPTPQTEASDLPVLVQPEIALPADQEQIVTGLTEEEQPGDENSKQAAV